MVGFIRCCYISFLYIYFCCSVAHCIYFLVYLLRDTFSSFYISLPVCLSACLSLCLPACLSLSLSICVFLCLPVCLSACLSACLSVCLSVCLPVYNLCLPLSIPLLSITLFLINYIKKTKKNYFQFIYLPVYSLVLKGIERSLQCVKVFCICNTV